MAFRRSPVRTLGCPAAHPAKARKYTGPATGEGKSACFFMEQSYQSRCKQRVGMKQWGTKATVSLRWRGGGLDGKGSLQADEKGYLSCAAKHLLFLVENKQKQTPRSARDDIVGALSISLHAREGEERGLLQLVGRGNDRSWDGQATRGVASQSHSGRGRVPSRSPVYLRSKPECPFVSWGLCSRLHLRLRIQDVTLGEAARPHPRERGAGAPQGMRLAPGAEGLKMKAGKFKKTGG
jgi:hypothetical protein